ncbi:putative isoflavone 2'-hydroxylase [Helianthus annuus]|nr:putative isoflavone 2'-hydroxylase [Helianthus annuus]
MEVPYLYISLFLLLASYLFTTHFRSKSANLPPTVFPVLPIIGHLYLLKLPLYRTLAKISTKYGPVLLLRFGFRRVLLISSPSAAEECFTTNDIIFANRPRLLFGKIIGNNYTSFGWASYGEHWRNLRRIASLEILSTRRINEFYDARVDEGRLLIRKLMSNSSPTRGIFCRRYEFIFIFITEASYIIYKLIRYSSTVNLRSVFYELTLNMMMKMISGKRYFGGDIPALEEEGERFREMMDETFLLSGAANVGDYLPVCSWLGVKRLEKKLIVLQEKLDSFFQRLIEQLRTSKEEMKNTKKTMIEVLLSLQESDPEYYTDQIIRSFVQVLIFAGTDTSSGTMEWSLSLLLNHPQVLRKAQNEIDRKIGNDRLVEESDIVDLPYLRGILNETLRLYPTVPLLVPHESSRDCIIEGYNVPRGTMLLVNQWAIHHDPKLWTDPERFNPERFEELGGTRDGFKLMPFGSGRRGCPGEGLAVRMIGLTLGLLIQCFDWERLSDNMIDMKEGLGVTMPKAEPLVAMCKPRLEMQDVVAQL